MNSEGNKKRLKTALGVLAIVLITFAVYQAILPGNFLMDDSRLTGYDNPIITGKLKPYNIWFRFDFTLAMFGWWAEHALFGSDPTGYHVVNIVLHAASSLLLWRLLKLLNIPGAWLAGALFAVHPVCVNSVARISELKNTLSLPFLILSFIGYLRYEAVALYPAEPGNPQRSSGKAAVWLTVSLVAFVVSLLAKTTAVMLPVVMLLCALWQRGRITKKDIIHTLPFFALSLAFGLMSVWYQKHQALQLAGQTLPPVSFPQRLAGAGYIFWFYLGKALFPVNLCLQYPGWKIDPAKAAAYLPGLLVCGVFIVSLIFWRSWGRHVLFGVGSFAVILFPALGFFNAQFLTTWQVSDHLQYAALPAVISLVASGLAALPKTAFTGAAAALLVGSSILCATRAEAFKTQENLMVDTIAKNPQASGAHNDLGIILAVRGNYSKATQEFKTAVQCDPNNADARVDLGHALMLEENPAEAESNFLAALKIEPYNPQAHKTYADLLRKEGRNAEALYHMKTGLLFKPDFETYMGAASLEYQIGHSREAVAYFQRALALKRDPGALNDLAWILSTCPDSSVRDGNKAVGYAEEACRLTGNNEPGMVGTLAAAYAEAGRFSEAITTAETAENLATDAGDTQLASMSRNMLLLYRAGKPYRETAARKR